MRTVERRAKYLLIGFDSGTLILHLGMSGSLRILPVDTAPDRHDHVDLQFGEQCLRLRDPRRFGAVLWTDTPVAERALITRLEPEPLSDAFDTDHLYTQARRRRIPIKQLLMDGTVVVGVGNIYATESLFLAGIHPARPCNRIARARIALLVERVKQVLARTIEQGGTTLRASSTRTADPAISNRNYWSTDARARPALPAAASSRPAGSGNAPAPGARAASAEPSTAHHPDRTYPRAMRRGRAYSLVHRKAREDRQGFPMQNPAPSPFAVYR